MSDDYPFDPDVRDHVAGLLYELLPALYRVRDEGKGDLRQFLRVLAAPLAELRQNVEELHGDLFIDSCNEWIIPYIAELVGTTLIFPDASSNRRDVRGTVGWRRRKGTRDALEEMGSDLSGQTVVTQEGWKRLLVAQDINHLRLERTVTDLRPARLAEAAVGPLDAAFHAADLRCISAASGRYHPRQIVHWTHPTQLFPVREGTAFDYPRGEDGTVIPPDLRYAFHPLGRQSALRVRRLHPQDPIPTDRAPAMHFATSPGTYFDQEGSSNGRFTVRLSGLPAAVAAPVRDDLRQPSRLAAHASLGAAPVDVTLLEEPLERLSAPIHIEVFWGATWRGGVRVPVQAMSTPPTAGDGSPLAAPITMIRLSPEARGSVAYFPGAIVELSSKSLDARHASPDPRLRADGFLRGALLVELPATWVHGARWFYLAADGSIYDAQSEDAAAKGSGPDVELDTIGGAISFKGQPLTTGPGPAWPPLGRTAVPGRMRRVPSAPGRGPVILHAGPVRKKNGGVLEAINETTSMALVFAARIGRGKEVVVPFLRLTWTGDDPLASDAFDVLDVNGTPVTSGAMSARLQEIATAREKNPEDIELVVRFEATERDLVLPPCEVSYTSDDGQTLLIYLPALEASNETASGWASKYPHCSLPVSVGEDGATYFVGGTRVARHALGPVAPLQKPSTLRRRRVRQRTLCGWDREEPGASPPKMLAPTPAGYIDIDPEHGLFALAKDEPPRPFPAVPGSGFRPSPVTVDYQEGYSDHIGARPDVREPILNQRQPTPTRIVSASGKLHPGAPAAWHAIPLHLSLAEAFADIEESDKHVEVIQFEDSATYTYRAGLTWPTPPTTNFVLVLQAAESQRPVILLDNSSSISGTVRYASVLLRGLTIHGRVQMPDANRIDIQLCTIAPDAQLAFTDPADEDPTITIERSLTGELFLPANPGTLRVRNSVIHSSTRAIVAPDAVVELDRVTAISPEAGHMGGAGTLVRVLEATHAIFLAKVQVSDRFQGCIRYSRAPHDSVLPRKHRVVDVPVRFVSRDPHDPAHARLAPEAAREILRGAEDGSEMGAFHGVRLAQRQDALGRRLVEFTPAGFMTGTVRMD